MARRVAVIQRVRVARIGILLGARAAPLRRRVHPAQRRIAPKVPQRGSRRDWGAGGQPTGPVLVRWGGNPDAHARALCGRRRRVTPGPEAAMTGRETVVPMVA